MQAAAQRYCVSQQGLRSGGRVEERPQSLKRCVVINRKTTKFESNSQRRSEDTRWYSSCYQSQNYKIWKQFTTLLLCSSKTSLLLSITKLQNLKTIHNHTLTLNLKRKVVINRRTTKFESNSQLVTACDNRQQRCYQSQNYKFWKQFTTIYDVKIYQF